MPWQTLLVPYDFSPSAEHALAIAAPLARLHRARVVLAHVIELSPHFGPETTLILPEDSQTPIGLHHYTRARAEADLREVVGGLPPELPVTTQIREGAPAAELLALIGELGVDLVVMGTHGRAGWRRLIAGSVAERLVRHSPAPVLTIRHPG
jgi:nucleotide-binding universal stress UspA family protein